MAWVDGEEATLHKLDGDTFFMPDGTSLIALRVELNKSEMMGLTESGQAAKLLTNYEPVVIDDDRVAFKLRSNHSRLKYRRQLKQARRRLEQDARNNNNGGKVPHSDSSGNSGSDPAGRPEAKTGNGNKNKKAGRSLPAKSKSSR